MTTATERGRANADKGKRAERDLVTWLRGHGWPRADRTVRTGHRTHTRVSADRGDVDGTPGLAWQVKDVAEREMWRIDQWLVDTEAQRVAAGAIFGLLVIKRRGCADPGRWWVWVPLCMLVGRPSVHVDVGRAPIRMELGHLVALLRATGYGTEVST